MYTCMLMLSHFSCVRLFVTPWTVAARLLSPWDFPGKNTEVGCHSLLQRTFLTQGCNPGLPHCRQILYHLSHQGSPEYLLVLTNFEQVIDPCDTIQTTSQEGTRQWVVRHNLCFYCLLITKYIWGQWCLTLVWRGQVKKLEDFLASFYHLIAEQ